MSDDKPKPVDDLKQGLNLLFRAAKGAIDKLPTEKIEAAVKDGAKEVGKAIETVADEVDKVYTRATTGGSASPPQGNAQPPEPTTAEPSRNLWRVPANMYKNISTRPSMPARD